MKKMVFLTLFALIATMGFAQFPTATITTYNIVEKDGKFGILIKDTETLLPCEYSEIYFHEGMAIVAKGGTKDGTSAPLIGAKWAVYNYFEEMFTTPFKYDKINFCKEGLATCNIGGKYVKWEKQFTEGYDCIGGLWGYIDCRTGKEIISPQYDNVETFRDGVAMVSKNGVTTLLKNPLLVSDVDRDIPVADRKNEDFFAFIIANQDYAEFDVPFANNDGVIFKEYCIKALGIPEKNIRFYANATYGNMASAVNKIKEIADIYDGDARFIVYYSGQGYTDESSKMPYLLPVDAILTNLTATGYNVEKLNKELSLISAKSTLLILDASFNGCDRKGKMLIAARSIAVKAKPNYADGSLIALSAATGDETAYQYEDKNHGLLTYYLLKKLQETKGDITCKELCDYVISEVKKQSISNSKIQSPTVTVSDKLTNWQTLKIK
jgi:hypothetical protein